jgi:hypothetical protein
MINETIRSAVIALAAAGITATMTGAAYADDDLYAPHAQAAAHVRADGSLIRQKGIASVTHPSTGTYCIAFTDPDIQVRDSVPQATVEAGSGILSIRTTPHSFCGNAANTLTVFTRDVDGVRTDLSFTVTIP